MVQGTASHVGKSLLVTALCRIFSEMGYKVAPFKSQNMSLNSFINQNGEEIARSQVVQAMAARTRPIAEHNPVLLKPKGDQSSQIILMGKPFADYSVKEYYRNFIPQLIPHVQNSLKKLQDDNDLVIIEGAGSPAEINLMNGDIANMYIAKLANSPVILIADIDRGGVFASIFGTINLLKPEEQALIKFFVINKFRGEIELLKDGITQIEELVKKKCIGILPYIQDLRIPAEDSVSLDDNYTSGDIKVKIIKLPRISNFNDYEALSWEPEIQISYVSEPDDLDDSDVIIIPGTKNTIKDLLWMNEKGFSSKLRVLNERGYMIIGVCGGYQILGTTIIDMGIEGDIKKTYQGLGFLPIKTEFLTYDKITRQVQLEIVGLPNFNGLPIEGYEIHMGKIKYENGAIPLLKFKNLPQGSQNNFEGAINERKNVFGSLIHGFWNNDIFRKEFIEFLAAKKNKTGQKIEISNYYEKIEKNIQKLADVVRQNLDIEEIITQLGI